MKKKTVLICAILVITGIVYVLLNITNGFSNTRDTYASDVSYQDESRTFVNGTTIAYDLQHIKNDTYNIKTNATGKLKLTYSNDVEKGNIVLKIMQGDKTINEITLNKGGTKSIDVEKNTEYVLELEIQPGKGSADIQWK